MTMSTTDISAKLDAERSIVRIASTHHLSLPAELEEKR